SDYAVSYSDNTNVGTATVTVTGTSTGNFAGFTVTKTFSIAPATLTATYISESIAFGSTPVLAVDIIGYVNYEDSSVLTVVPTVSNMSTAVGSYVLIPAGGVATNYDFTYVEGTLTIMAVPEPTPTPTVYYTVTFAQPANGSIVATVDGVEIQSGDSVESGTIVLFTVSFGGLTGIDANWYVTVDNVADTESYVGTSLMYVISGDTHVSAEIHVIPNEPAKTGINFLWWILLVIAAIIIGSYVYLRYKSGA
ncbi:MAG: MBG domain-containing protein, partial [Candidatus Methanomethylophilaceae archaeon]|nr:MBG domain-containing protein [Candidatus Methanomethylophilaceae archaeon]